MALAQRGERARLIESQQKRWSEETKLRTARLPIGIKWLWHKASGQYQKIRAQNEAETKACLERDRKELHALVRSHLSERQKLQETVKAYKEEHKAEEVERKQAELYQAIRIYAGLQHKREEEQRRIEANKTFHSIILNMSYNLHGLLSKWGMRAKCLSPPS